MTRDSQQEWEDYKRRELGALKPVLTTLGFELEAEQPHLIGERYLQRAVTTIHGRKLILVGKRVSDAKRAVIKATSDRDGVYEIEHDRFCRDALQKLHFAYHAFYSPKETLFTKRNGFTIFIQEFLEQPCAFIDRPVEEQFHFALTAFKAQESAHAATYNHRRFIAKTFGEKIVEDYLHTFANFGNTLCDALPDDSMLCHALDRGVAFLAEHKKTIEQYSGFLTHIDFVPHNFRIVNGDIYLLDHSSIRFGNKYEGWARFVNFMEVYSRELARWLVQYVRDNRTEEESLSLKLMRIYRLGEIIYYYADTIEQSSGDLLKLNRARVVLWRDVLTAILADTPVPPEVIGQYKQTRDSLRSADEKKRQKGLH